MKSIYVVAVCCLMAASARMVSAKEWRGIVPLQSTRVDVERLLGPHKTFNGSLSHYETKDEEVTVMYASGPPCAANAFQMWSVSRDTVIGITVYPRKELRLLDLKLDETKYRKSDNEGHGPPYFYYTNQEEGIQYEVTQGFVMSIIYFPSAKDEHLRCCKHSQTSNSRPCPQGRLCYNPPNPDGSRQLQERTPLTL